VERNALRARLVMRAEDWPWCSLAQRAGRDAPISLAEWPVPQPPDWSDLVQLEVADETQDLRLDGLQMEAALSPIGRPEARR
jgi:hypothetical protein